jgi:anti-sigma regulatory factor (Ser/Thr protein kinase)
VADPADVGAARRLAAGFADQARATPQQRGRAELVAAELATNLLRHAKPGGWLLLRPVEPGGVELIAVDHGPGIGNPAVALAGHPPERGGLGCGLPAIQRAASRFALHTARDRGTAVLAVVDAGTPAAPPTSRCWAGVSVGIAEACGDGWSVLEVGDDLAVAVVDGLGHGAYASAAADAALRAFAVDPADLDGLTARANSAMRGTRGAAMLACLLRPREAVLHSVAVGNVAGRVVAGGFARGLLSVSGTLGLRPTPPAARVSTYPWPPGASLLVWTDGLRGRVEEAELDGLLGSDPALVAATLHRDHTRDRDDATAVVVHHRPADR